MMFAHEHPQIVYKIISPDSLRYPLPKNIPLIHFYAIDTKADKNVIPKNTNSILIKGVKHIDLCDRGSAYIKEEINRLLSAFLK